MLVKPGHFLFLLALFALLLPPAGAGGEEQPSEGDLEEEFALLEDESRIVESAARHQQDIGMSPSAITVITRADIATSGADNLADLFRLVPGLDVETDTPFFASLSGRLYWSNENQQFLLLIDGREANDDLAGSTFLSLQPIFLEDIERIEVIRGPGSTLYGANALAGVISITTRSRPRRTSAWARLAGGEPGAYQVAGRASLLAGEWGISLSGGLDYSGSFAEPRQLGRDVGKARLVVQRTLGDGELLLDCGYTRGRGFIASQLGRIEYNLHLLQPRLTLKAPPVKVHLYYIGELLGGTVARSIELGDVHLADFGSMEASAHALDGELQWDVPRFWQPLLVIAGLRLRGSWILSGQFLDGGGYTNPKSGRYHRPGIAWSELRTGGFLHTEFNPWDWLALTAGLRLDYDSTTGPFVSPRLAVVLQPWPNHFLRLGGARSFRKPSFQETNLHLPVEFPPDSPIQGAEQIEFLEFMSQAVGNPGLEPERLWAVEAGYQVRLLEGRLTADLQVYGNYLQDVIDFTAELVTTPEGLLDLEHTRLEYAFTGRDIWIWGLELSLRYQPSDDILLQAAWSHREIPGEDTTPKNLVLAGGRFLFENGLLGSLYLSTRSEFWDRFVENPRGLLYPALSQHLPSVGVFLGRLGLRFRGGNDSMLELGVRFYLPLSFADGATSYQGRGGGVTPDGYHYGGERLGRRLALYLEGTL